MNSTLHDGPHAYLFEPAVIVADWVAFFVLFGSAVVIGAKLMQFKGPSEQPEDYYFGYCIVDHSTIMARCAI